MKMDISRMGFTQAVNKRTASALVDELYAAAMQAQQAGDHERMRALLAVAANVSRHWFMT
jgi:predicted branched-subunit amino acid permease